MMVDMPDASATPVKTRSGSADSFAETLSRAIQRRNLSLERIHTKLARAGTPVSVATLSYWQTGRRVPTRTSSLQAVSELERILALPTGRLRTTLVDEPDDGSAVGSSFNGGDAITRTLQKLRLDPVLDVLRVSVNDIVSVSSDHRQIVQLTRQVMRAERDGVRSWPIVLELDDRGGAELSAVTACRVGRQIQLPEAGLIIAEMLLPRPLSKGDLVMTEHSLSWLQAESPKFVIERLLPRRVQEYVLQVSIGGTVPLAASAYRRPVHQHDAEESWPVAIQDGLVQVVLADVSPGVYGVAWDWTHG